MSPSTISSPCNLDRVIAGENHQIVSESSAQKHQTLSQDLWLFGASSYIADVGFRFSRSDGVIPLTALVLPCD